MDGAYGSHAHRVYDFDEVTNQIRMELTVLMPTGFMTLMRFQITICIIMLMSILDHG